MTPRSFLTASLLLLIIACPALAQQKRKPNPAMAPIKDQPGLPRVLLIGDSISIGYTVPVRELLKDQFNVHRPRTNCGPTTRGLAGLDEWLGEGKWDVIHFNFGLHDLKYLGPAGENLADPNADSSHQQVPITEYETNLRKIVDRLKKTGAQRIWCATTPVPEGAKGRVVGDSARYNAAALKVMKDNDVIVNDLFAYVSPIAGELMLKANVHFTKPGSKKLAEQVAKAIRTAAEK